jgi:transcriptional accessory protein Tex/SPT6
VVKAGQVVKVKVMSVDLARQRVALTMKLHEKVEGGGGARPAGGGGHGGGGPGGGRPGQGRPGGGGDRRPAAPAPREFWPKQYAAAANPFAAQLAKLKLKGQ